MVGFTWLHPLLAFDRPALLPFVLLASVIPARRHGSATTRALGMTIAFLIVLNLAAWLSYGASMALHALCTATGLAVTLPIAVRSRRGYPLVLAGALLLASIALGLRPFLAASEQPAAELIAMLAFLVLACTYWAGLLQDYRFRSRRKLSQSTAQ